MAWGKMETKIVIKERDELVYKLRKEGATFRHIASLLNISGGRVAQIYSRVREKKEDFETWPPLKQLLSTRPQTALTIYFKSASILDDPQRIAEFNLNGKVQDPRFLQFLEKVGRETLELFSTSDFLLLDHIHRERKIPDQLQNRLQSLVEKGVVERFGRGRGVKYILSRRYYKMVDEKGAYTRKKGLDRETNKALLLKHIEGNRDNGSRLKELMQVLPALSKDQVQSLIRELKADRKIYKTGTTRAALWYPENNEAIASVNNRNTQS